MIRLLLLVFVFIAILVSRGFSQTTRLSGYVKDNTTGEVLPGVAISVQGGRSGVQSNVFGYFSLKLLNTQVYQIVFSSLGYRSDTITVLTREENKEVAIRLNRVEYQLTEVIIKKDIESSPATQLNASSLTSDQIRQIPLIFGEKDPVKALELLPGVSAVSEGSSMFIVRGGGSDQNLILLDQAVVYNANHLFGFLSTFNNDPIKNIQLYKGGFPARYGGRLSSVVDVQMKEGSDEGFHGAGGIGILTSRGTIEGPIKKNKSSFLISARRTYADAFTFLLFPDGYRVKYHFYDLNGKMNYTINPKNKIFWSIYNGRDKLSIKENVDVGIASVHYNYGMNWGNVTSTLRWNHIINNKLFVNTSLITTKFKFAFSEDYLRKNLGNTASQSSKLYRSSIGDIGIRSDFDYFFNLAHSFRGGAMVTRHVFAPEILNQLQEKPLDSDFKAKFNRIVAWESSAYVEEEARWTDRLSSHVGIRFNAYKPERKLYVFVEPRVILSYRLTTLFSIKSAYAKSSQFIHLLSNTGVGFPTDLWIPSSDKLPVSTSDQITLGMDKRFDKSITISLEAYYKWLNDVISYKEDVTFIAASKRSSKRFWDNNITTGKGWAYGYEALIRKSKGRLTGWLGYTLSWSIRKFADLNNGKSFYARQDRRHDIEIVTTYELNKKLRLSANWVFTSGNPITPPLGSFTSLKGDTMGLIRYGSVNGYRTAPVHRLDLGLQWYIRKNKSEQFWELSLYNAYNRQNPFYYVVDNIQDIDKKTVRYNLRSKSLFPILPSISYNLKF